MLGNYLDLNSLPLDSLGLCLIFSWSPKSQNSEHVHFSDLKET